MFCLSCTVLIVSFQSTGALCCMHFSCISGPRGELPVPSDLPGKDQLPGLAAEMETGPFVPGAS